MKSRFKDILKRVLGFVAYVAWMPVLLAGCGNSEPEKVTPMVQIKTEQAVGSGIVYEQRGDSLIIITAAHVLQGASDAVEIIFADGYSVESHSYTLSQTSDVAFITIFLEEIPEKHLQKYDPVRLDKKHFDALTEGEKVTVQGFSADEQLLTLDGTILYPWIYAEDFKQYMMLIRGEVLPGMSGGGVFDSEENFIGIICGVSEEREIATVPLSIIIAEYSLICE